MPDPNKVLEENITYAVGPDVIKGWASRQFLPPAILSEFTPFVSLWAVGDDYIKQGAANRSGDLGGIQSIKFQNISRLENRRISPEHQVTENDIVLSSIVANIKGSDSTDISDRPIQLIPLLSNVTQLVTKDFRGGVGLTQFSTTFNCQSPLLFKSEATIEILNPYDLQDETLTITRLLVPGAYYVAIAGWQCNDRSIDSNYVDIDGKKVDIILPPQFDKVPGEFFAYADPNDKSTLQMYLDIKDTHNGFIQCFVMRLQGMKFRIEGNKIIASLTFCNPSTFIADKITLINIQSQINSLLSGISLELTEAAPLRSGWSKCASPLILFLHGNIVLLTVYFHLYTKLLLKCRCVLCKVILYICSNSHFSIFHRRPGRKWNILPQPLIYTKVCKLWLDKFFQLQC